ncbi:hypothetical protein VTL71DRAFT_2242 [Oculimacula yallundae]|uniref:Uncharacterized protein n=1 Tax=Oculimacula yallundae TaxID=86028 RepID=A0ABR4C9M6_9HELO
MEGQKGTNERPELLSVLGKARSIIQNRARRKTQHREVLTSLDKLFKIEDADELNLGTFVTSQVCTTFRKDGRITESFPYLFLVSEVDLTSLGGPLKSQATRCLASRGSIVSS